MKLLIILGNYLPKSRANGICTNEVIKELIKRGHDVHVICYADSNNYGKVESINDVHVYRVWTPKINKFQSSTEKERSKLSWKIRYNYYKMITRLSILIFLPFYPLTSIKMVYQYYKKAKEIYYQEHYDIVISVYAPLEAIIAGTLISKKFEGVKSGIYALDSLTNHQGKSILKWWFDKSGWLWEKRLYKYNDFIVNMVSFREKYGNPRYERFNSKIYFSDIPLYTNEIMRFMEEDNSHNHSYNHNKNKWLYVGNLNRKTRNPEYLCNLFIDNKLFENNEMHFYSNGNCEGIISNYSAKLPGVIFQHGFIPRNEILKKIKEASILVSIGNKNSIMVPSKIFEYISTGKKIIHFYSDDNDSCLKYLQKYQNALFIDEKNSIEMNSAKIREFIDDKTSITSIDDIDNTFELNKPSYTADIIEKFYIDF